MSTAADLLRARVAADARPTVRLKIWLDPEAASKLAEAEAELENLRNAAIESGAAVKTGGRIAELAQQVERYENELLDAQAVLVLRALTSTQVAQAVAGLTEDDPVSLLWQRKLKAAFVRIETIDGQVVDDITAEDWGNLLEVMSAAEIQACHHKLTDAETAANPR